LQLLSQASSFLPTMYDRYAMTIDEFPPGMTPESFIDEFKASPNKAANSSTFNYLAPFTRRREGPPRLGEIYDIDFPMFDDGSVMLVDETRYSFTFHTVWTNKYGYHPVNGARTFGIGRTQDNRYYVYTAAASRPRLLVHQLGEDVQFSTWISMLEGICKRVIDLGGKCDPKTIHVKKTYGYPQLFQTRRETW
jgi:hypothetical protein